MMLKMCLIIHRHNKALSHDMMHGWVLVVMGRVLNDQPIPSLESQARAKTEPRPFKKSSSPSLDGPLLLLHKNSNFLGPFQKVEQSPLKMDRYRPIPSQAWRARTHLYSGYVVAALILRLYASATYLTAVLLLITLKCP